MFGFLDNSLYSKILVYGHSILFFIGLLIYIKLWKNQTSKFSETTLWVTMFFCFSAGIVSGAIYENILAKNRIKENAIYYKENCKDVVTKKSGYSLKVCPDGYVGELNAVTEYMEENDYKTNN